MKRIFTCLTAALLGLMLCACGTTPEPAHTSSKAVSSAPSTAAKPSGPEENSGDSMHTSPSALTGIRTVPEGYEQAVKDGGRLEILTYRSRMISEGKRTVTKHAMVYLPAGYSSQKRYDILYLAHGRGASYRTFLGSPMSPRPFKYMLDHMIKEKEIRPLIVVAMNITEEYKDYFHAIEGLQHEIGAELIPAAESKYSTYAASVKKKDLTASREHRGMAGFSMGGLETWQAFEAHLNYFKYFLPMSMPAYPSAAADLSQYQTAARHMAQAAERLEYSRKDYYIFAATGSEDFMYRATQSQVRYLKQETKQFRYTDRGFGNGNLMFHVWKGHYHRFSQSYPYLYNGLIRFFPAEKTSKTSGSP